MKKDKKPIHVTPVGVAEWPHLNRPDTKFDEAGVFRTKLRLPADAAAPLVELIDAAFQAAHELDAVKEAKKKGKKIKEADLPYQNATDDQGEETGEIVFSFKIKASGERKDGTKFTRSVPLWDAKRQPTKADVWGGSKIRVAFTLNPFYVPALGVGVSLQLGSVQVIELVQGQPRTAEGYGFDEEEGYVAAPEGGEEFEGEGEKGDSGPAPAAKTDDKPTTGKAAVNF